MSEWESAVNIAREHTAKATSFFPFFPAIWRIGQILNDLNVASECEKNIWSDLIVNCR